MHISKRFRHKLEYAAVAFLMMLIRIFPLMVLRAVGASLGWFAFRVLRIRRRVTIENISNALGADLEEAQIAAIGLRSYMNMGKSLVEFASFEKLTAEQLQAMVEIEGLHHFNDALSLGKGAILFAGHFDNWELLGAGIVRNDYPVHFLVGEQSNKLVDNLMNRLRMAQGVRIISRQVALKKVLRALSDNQIVGMLPDQDAGRSGVFVDFFGRPASTYKGPATFAIKQGCPIIPGFIIRERKNHHRAIIEKPIWPHPALDQQEAVRDMTQRYTNLLEAYIRRHPDHYFWAHRRWKTKKLTN